ncbi:asparagine synthase C-terminal domain-containing protein [Mycoavidus sp. SF9855]|uniref:asparagine synthase-related protein n=1 Tax=Mycoavidus sp. SF9855 TaxID=2968475 RepID=UPI00211CB845|nr:asparagine synthase C-terminal domain-containing protein [Mycoavidus sp. SF9855]UUM20739.1 asparagine synthase C-terminal domain-containing protein [Mycoavidus sp. SF9855]
MTVFGIAYPETQELLTLNRDWALTHDKTGQIAGALWQEADERHSARILSREDERHFYCLYGQAFSKQDNTEINDSDLREIALKGPSLLTAKFWGTYLFVCFDKVARKFICCCDPSNRWTVYWSWSERHGLLFSDTITCLHQVLTDMGERPAWNRSFFTTWLRTGTVQSGALPFDRISELPPGCAVFYTHGREPEMSPVWDPLMSPAYNSLSQNPYDILKNYLSLYVSNNDRPVLELSGGLESSSILLALREIVPATQPLVCAHYYNSEVGSSNELEHARRVAQSTGAYLSEIDNKVFSFAPIKQIPRFAKPHNQHGMLAFRQHFASRLDERENSMLISGHGGDSLFLAPPPFGVLADAALTLRWRHLFRTAMDLALIHRKPFAQIIWQTIKSSFSPNPYEEGDGTFRLLSDAVQLEPLDGRSHLHPFLQKTKIRLPGKLYQLFLAYSALDDVSMPAHPFKRSVHHPFLCQLMVEFALSIPSYRHFEGPHNRIIVRKSVSTATGYPHLWRHNKGEITGINLLGIRQHKNHVMAHCLEGFLAKEGYIDPIRTHTAIQENCKGHNAYLMDILRIYVIELFIQSWQ